MRRLRIVRRGAILLAAGCVSILAVVLGGSAEASPARAVAADTRTDLEWQALDDVNQARTTRGLAPLAADDMLVELARERSADMATRGYFSHYDANGSPIYVQLLDEHNIWFGHAGENLAWNVYGDDVSARTAVDGWIASPPHAANLFSGDYDKAGLGVVSVDGKKYYTLIFLGE
jgi:uncharacterized protein YkwD